jgi:hypothetical protein
MEDRFDYHANVLIDPNAPIHGPNCSELRQFVRVSEGTEP